ncbi:uncharacterized protein LOC143290091 [Babylonia areolata]|uniref:uncharacterized protein LOC143290091 n=1 Tax=Babylonia areolata TaxID=304850 RepID=UPI003FD5B664
MDDAFPDLRAEDNEDSFTLLLIATLQLIVSRCSAGRQEVLTRHTHMGPPVSPGSSALVPALIQPPSYPAEHSAARFGHGVAGSLTVVTEPKLIKLKSNYYLAFRGTAGIGFSIYQAYVSTGHDDTVERRSVIPCGCLDIKGKKPCDRHYKSKIVHFWSLMDIDQVRVSVYSDGMEKVFFLFNGEGTTSLDFFKADNLVASSFGDINPNTTTFNYFSIKGHERLPEVQRRFFVNSHYAKNCHADAGWMVVVDKAEMCEFTRRHPVPAVLYSDTGTSQVWKSGVIGSGDILVVAVRFKKGFNPNTFEPSGSCIA